MADVSTAPPRGVYVPLVTPFNARGRVDVQAVADLAGGCIDDGARGVVALATTGEASALDDTERADVIAACAEVCADRDAELIVGAGTNDTRTTLARHEALADVRAVSASLAVVPYYVRPTESAIVAHFQHVAARSPVPIVVYNVPYRTGRGLGAAALLELAATDNIVGLKQAVGGVDADTLELLGGLADASFGVLGGDDPFLFPLALMGASGAVAASAHLFTRQFVDMVDHGIAGRVADGRPLAELLLPLVRALFAEPSPAVLKAVLHAEGLIPTPDVRMPLANATPSAVRVALEARAMVTSFPARTSTGAEA